MAFLQIKEFPDELYEKLQARAKQKGRSISQEVIDLLDGAISVRRRGVPFSN